MMISMEGWPLVQRREGVGHPRSLEWQTFQQWVGLWKCVYESTVHPTDALRRISGEPVFQALTTCYEGLRLCMALTVSGTPPTAREAVRDTSFSLCRDDVQRSPPTDTTPPSPDFSSPLTSTNCVMSL